MEGGWSRGCRWTMGWGPRHSSLASVPCTRPHRSGQGVLPRIAPWVPSRGAGSAHRSGAGPICRAGGPPARFPHARGVAIRRVHRRYPAQPTGQGGSPPPGPRRPSITWGAPVTRLGRALAAQAPGDGLSGRACSAGRLGASACLPMFPSGNSHRAGCRRSLSTG